MTMRPLGRSALDTLMQLGNPRCVALTLPRRDVSSLLRRGLIAPWPRGGWRITSEGLTTLATLLRNGTIDDHIATAAPKAKRHG